MQEHAQGKANRLINETSPYLLQHAYNPVEWYAWGNEALEKAIKEDKPIFLSIGYSSCHWCHVMAHESFEDEETAKIMNENYINIKVDREERPDVDDVYQRVCQLASGSGGWPLSVFLTPDQKPFYVGTYFPKESSYGRPGFKTILTQLSDAYKNKKNEIESATGEFMHALSHMAKDITPGNNRQQMGQGIISIERSVLDEAAVSLLQLGDPIYGGFGQAPKFPNASNLLFMLRYYDISGVKRFRDFVVFTADKMAAGGIYDHLGGGFARYSTDQKWLVPHFEKMLYDNALLTQVYSELYQITNDKKYLAIVDHILDYISREMTSPEGGFYSSQDADSEGEEGKFYVWSKREISEILADPAVTDIFCQRYGVTEGGNFEGKNILNIRTSTKELGPRFGKTQQEIEGVIKQASARLFAEREKRIRPGRDDKILVSWNSLMVSGLVKAYQVTRNEKYLESAKKAINFIETKISEGERLHRTFKDGHAKLNAYLDDYAFYVNALLDVFSVESSARYLDLALKYTGFLIARFWDENDGNFFFTSDDAEKLIVRTKSFYDLAIPSGNSVAASNLLRLYHLTQNNDYLQKATRIMNAATRPAAENPFGFGQLLNAMYLYVKKPVEITIISLDGGRNSEMVKWLGGQFVPDGINAMVSDGQELEKLQKYAFFNGRNTEAGSDTAFVCRNFTCSLPIKTLDELKKQIGIGTSAAQ